MKSDANQKEQGQQPQDPREAANEHFIELLDEHGAEPRIRARLVEVLESRTGDGPSTEAIQITEGESYTFTNDEGVPVLWISFDTEGTPTVEFNRYAESGPTVPTGASTAAPQVASARRAPQPFELSIASKCNPERGKEWRDTYLFEPENGEMRVSIIAGEVIGTEPHTPVEEFAQCLLDIRDGIMAGEIEKTINTINMLVELAYLHTRGYGQGLERFRAELAGRLREDGSSDAEELPASEPEATGDERRRNLIELGEHLAAVVKNPEIPQVLYDEIGHALSDLSSDAAPMTTIFEDLEENWPRITEMLLARSQGEVKK